MAQRRTRTLAARLPRAAHCAALCSVSRSADVRAVVRLLVEAKAFRRAPARRVPSAATPAATAPAASMQPASPAAASTVDARDPFTKLLTSKQQQQHTAQLQHIHSYQAQAPLAYQQQQMALAPLRVHGGSSSAAAAASTHSSPSTGMANMQLAQPFVLPSSSSAAPAAGAAGSAAAAGSATVSTIPATRPASSNYAPASGSAPAPATSLSRLPWDRTGMSHSSILTASASVGRETFVPRFPSDKVAKKMDAIKLKHRSSLKLPDWQRYGYAKCFAPLRAEAFASMPRPICGAPGAERLADGRAAYPLLPAQSASAAAAASSRPALSYSVDRVHWKELSLEQFRTRYEIPKIPVIIQGLTDTWEMRNWDLNAMGGENGSHRNVPMKCGEVSDALAIHRSYCPRSPPRTHGRIDGRSIARAHTAVWGTATRR